MIVCHCAGVTDRDIARLVEQGATTVREITRQCGAGMHCAPCRSQLREMLCTVECPAVEAAA